jgi:hypothetical protein
VNALLHALDIDAAQWRALLRAYVRIDFRAAGGPEKRRGRRAGGSQLIALAVVGFIGGVALGAVAAAVPDVMTSASLLTTYAAATTTMMLLVDFTGVVIAPEDYVILGARPVTSRTYFAARLSAVGIYVTTLSVANAIVPAVVYGVRHGVAACAATIVGVVLCDATTTVLVISGYVSLLRWIPAARLRRAMGYVQLVGASVFYLAYYLATLGFQHAFVDRLGFDRAPWLWSVPSTWYAAPIAIAAGGATTAAWIASAAAMAATFLCVPLAAGRLSLDYARRIGELATVSEPPRPVRKFRLPGFGRGEARAVALLVRAQFRFDQRFRMAVLGILPLTGFYMLLGLDQGALRDPFTGAAGGPGVFFAVMFIPMTLHTALSSSESWRAAWVFFATPASHARIVIAAKIFVAVYFLGTYIVALAAFWSWFFERVWHAAIHAFLLGVLAHMLLQLAVIVRPMLPFATEPRQAQRAGSMFLLFLLGGIAAAVFPMALHLIYRSPTATAGLCALLVALTAAIEYALRLRVDEAIGELELRS